MLDKVEVLEWYDDWIVHSATWETRVPAVMILKEYQKKKTSVRFSKQNVFLRDLFTCQYCGDNPGSKNLEVDHLIPRSKGGSDNRCNLVTACVTCNGRKSNTISFPKKMIERDDTEEGWKVHKSFGVWAVKFNDTTVVIEDNRSWWFDVLKLSRDSNFAGYHLQIKLESWEL